MALSGDPRRLAAEPAISGVVHFHGPYPYRCPFYSTSPEQATERSLAHLHQVIQMEGVGKIAAIFLEGINGSSGLLLYPPGYMEGVRKLCDQYGILLVIDEVMSGFGRTGKWFGCEHYEARPDILTMAKGLTGSYLPLGAVVVNQAIADHFETNPMVCGLTYSGHPVSCSAALAVIETYEEEGILAKAEAMGKIQDELLAEMKAKHPSVGDVRNVGLFGVIECVKDRETREPMAPWNASPAQMGPMAKAAAYLREHGLMTFVRWNWIFCVPPLTITEAQIREAYEIIDGALSVVDESL
jgi:taurine--2-oxoglutarate transaminase